MDIGIIGAGTLGSNLARLLARSGISATIANSRGPQSLAGLTGELGPSMKAGTVGEAASAGLVIVAVPWVHLEEALAGLPAWNDRIVVDATNPFVMFSQDSPEAKDPNNPLAAYGIRLVDLHGSYSSAVFRKLVPGAHVVKAFNHLAATDLLKPTPPGGKRVLFYSGDETDAKSEVRKIIEQVGCFPVDLGRLDVGGPLMGGITGALAGNDFIRI